MGGMRWLYALALATGCGFEHGSAGAIIDAPESPGAEPTACVTGFLDLCGQADPTMALDVQVSSTINTDTDPRCRTLTQTGGGPVCLVYVTQVLIAPGATLTATGSRPLAIASTSTMAVSGTIDVASRRTDGQIGPGANGTCTFSATPEMDLGGAGGGAGASFGAIGGNGGRGDSDSSLGSDDDAAPGFSGPALTPTVLRGGCRGQAGADETTGGGVGGAGGHSGGALYLYATSSITISSTALVRASGAGALGGGVQAGGGGGGSGGMVVVESPTITVAGTIAANGGGGGEGGARLSGGGGGSTNVSGQPGADGGNTTTIAAGGAGSDNRFGFGGSGGAGSTAAANGTAAVVAGGGGGGGVGIIKLRGAATVTGTVTPGAT